MPPKKNNSISKTFFNKRKSLGFSQLYIAKKLGITQTHYQKVETGSVKLNLEQYFKICDLLNLGASVTLWSAFGKNNASRVNAYFKKEMAECIAELIRFYKKEIGKKDTEINILKNKQTLKKKA